jgi:hypothetical protein
LYVKGILPQKQQPVAALNSPAVYAKNDTAKIQTASDRLAHLDMKLDCAYQRWNDLEDLAAKFS